MEQSYSRIYAKINLDNIIKNMESITANLPQDTKIIGVLKTDGYGHGAVPAAKVIDPFVWGYATATPEEAVNLRIHHITKPIMVLGNASQQYNQQFLDYEISPCIFEYEKAETLSELAGEQGKKATIHIAVDTGMSRIGYMPTSDSLLEIKRIFELPNIIIEGLFTHFSKADETNRTATEEQYRLFTDFAEQLKKIGVEIPIKHCANSAAIIDHSQMSLNAVRAGIAIYGLYPSKEVGKEKINLQPVMELYSFVTYVKEIEAGTSVSYGGTFVADKTMTIATVGAGYGDGYPRNLSGKGEVLIRGQRAKILGRVCMDQFMVDVSNIPNVSEDDRVTLIGCDGEEFISMEELADTCKGFHYEIPCVLGKRVPRLYMKDQKVIGKKDYNEDIYEDFLF